MFYKRGQIDSALFAILSGSARKPGGAVTPVVPSIVRKRITHLLEIDRKWGFENRHRLHEFPMAFHDEVPSGTGTDIAYTAFSAFALAIGLEMLRVGFKQGEVVEALALRRPDLEENFKQAVETVQVAEGIRYRDGTKHKLPTYVPKRRGASREPQLDFHIFLAVRQIEMGPELAALSGGAVKASDTGIGHAICPGWDDLVRFMQQEIPNKTRSMLVIELTDLAAWIAKVLPQQPVRRRGRK